MSRRIRTVVLVCALGGAAATIAGWTSGFFSAFACVVGRVRDEIAAWLDAPLSWSHLLGGAGVLLVVALIVVALVDG